MSKKNKNTALPTWDRAFSVEEGRYTHDDYEDVDLTVDLDPIIITASLPKLSSRADYRRLDRYAKAYRRGEINREQIPFKFRSYLANTQEEQQQRAYEMFAEEEAAKELSNELGWDKLAKAYATGMSAVIGVPAVSSIAGEALTEEALKAAWQGVKEIGKNVGSNAKDILNMARSLTKEQIGNFLMSMTAAGAAAEAGDQYANSKGYHSFEDMMHESWFGGNPLSQDFSGELARLGYSFLRPDMYLGGLFGSKTASTLARKYMSHMEKLILMGQDISRDRVSPQLKNNVRESINKTFAEAKQGVSDWAQKVGTKVKKQVDKIAQQEWVDYFRWAERKALREKMSRLRYVEGKYLELKTRTYRDKPTVYDLGKDRMTPYFPLHSNNEEYIQQYFRRNAPGTKVTRISDTEIKVEIDPTEIGRVTWRASGISVQDPELSLPEGINLARVIPGTESINSVSFTLTYPKKGASKPIIKADVRTAKPSTISAQAEYWMLPDEFKTAIKAEMDHTRSIIGGFKKDGTPDPLAKTFGSTVSSSEGFLPHISDDVDYIVSRNFYDTHIKGKVPEYPGKNTTRGGQAHAYTRNGELKKLDVVIIENGPNGKANPTHSIAMQLFAKIDPIGYNTMLKKHAVDPERYPYYIPYSADELVSMYDPVVGNLIDTFTAQASKAKHLGRSYVMLERAPLDKLEQALTTIGKMRYAEGYTPLDTSLFDLTDVKRNLKFLSQIGFAAENPEKIATSPKRMALIMEEYNQHASGLYRGDGYLKTASTRSSLQDKIDQFAVQATEWLPGSGNVRGTGKNYVRPGNSGYGPYYSARQADINKYLKAQKQLYPDDLVDFYTSLDSAHMPDDLRLKLDGIVKRIAEKYHAKVNTVGETSESLHNAISSLYGSLDVQGRKQLLQELDDLVPFIEGIVDKETYKGSFLPNKKGAYFLAEDHYPFEISGSAGVRYKEERIRANRGIDVKEHKRVLETDKQDYKHRPSIYSKTEKELVRKAEDREIAMQNIQNRIDRLDAEWHKTVAKLSRVSTGLRIAALTSGLGAGGLVATSLIYAITRAINNKKAEDTQENTANTTSSND